VGLVRLTGADRRSYLQGLLTNDIEALTPGTGCYAALLTAQGRMISDMRVLELGDAVLLEVPASLAANVASHLDRFVFSEDVQARDITAEKSEVGLYGPSAGRVVAHILPPTSDLHALPLNGTTTASFDGSSVTIVRSDDAGVDGYDIVVDVNTVEKLKEALVADGAVVVDAASAEAARIEAGRPRFGVDMDSETIPLEAGIDDRAISRTKGCYVGQEVIIRVLDRGHGRVARRLVKLAFPDRMPAPGQKLLAGEREIGRITSVAFSPSLGHPVALGYVQRDFTTAGTSVSAGQGISGTVVGSAA
jgi:folate-binding protein YgfZ